MWFKKKVDFCEEIYVKNDAELMEATFWADKKNIRLFIPVDKLVMQGGFNYANKHPFVDALNYGRNTLEEFYRDVQPKDIASFYNLSKQELVGEDLPAWEIPWYFRSLRTAPRGEEGLDSSHGVSFYGPVSEKKINLEMSRLNSTLISIKKEGYNPNKYGDISGYVMFFNGMSRFFVRGGKHRAAVLSYLGEKYIPVVFKENFPRLIDVSKADFWPLVLNNMMSKDLAIKIASKYFD